MAKRKKVGLSYKRQLFARKYVETKSTVDAAMQSHACKSRRVGSTLGLQLLQNDQVRREIERIMDEYNITDEKVVEKLSEGLESTVISDYKGEAVQTDLPDMKTRHKYLESVIEIKGLKAPLKTESVNLDLKVEAMSMEEVAAQVKEQLKLLQAGK